jgi:CubicO group peptidase (beta-lactamase class C family)
MMLVEEGKIQLLDPVSHYLPEFKGVQVGVEKLNTTTGNSELIGEPPRQEMTIQDLLRHTSGLTYGIFGKSLVQQAYNEANLFDRNQTLAEFVSKIAKLPLAYHPGTTWEYSHSTDVLGRIVEVVSGVTLDQFVADRIAKPLGLSDTGFYVPAEKLDRLAETQIDPIPCGKVFRNLIERLQFLSDRTARGAARHCFRPGHVIRFIAGSRTMIRHGRKQ